MAKKVRLSIDLERGLRDELAEEAAKRGMTASKLFARLIQFMGSVVEQRAIGRTHIGFVADATKLDAEFVL